MSKPRSALYVSEGCDLVHYSLDVEAGTIERKGKVSVPAEVHYVWPHPSKRWLYVASSDAHDASLKGEAKTHHLTAFRVAPDGALSPHGDPVPLPWRPIHNTVDASGRYAITAFNKPSTMGVHRLGEDGRIGEAVPQPNYLCSAIFPHQVRMLPSNRRLIQVARGLPSKPGSPTEPGALLTYSFEDGVLKLVDIIAPDGGFAFGPRHLDIHPTKPWLYVSLELQSELNVFSAADERIAPRPMFTHTLLAEPHNKRPRQIGGAIHIHPKGHAVYVINRADWPVQHEGQTVFGGGENSIAVFSIDPASGKPTPIQHAAFPAIHIRCFALDPEGRILIAAARNEMNVLDQGKVRRQRRTLTVYRVAADGKLAQANNYEVQSGEKPQIWMGIVPLPE